MSENAIASDLEYRYGIPGSARFEAGPNGLVCAAVETPHAEATVYLHGAHITQYHRRGDRPLLFTSRASRFLPDQPIRGGVPIVFPWFGPHPHDPSAPMHGFARLATWSLEALDREADGTVVLTFGLDAARATHPGWPNAYQARYVIRIGSRLELALEVHNPSDQTVTFEEALHTYLAVADIRAVQVLGLAGTTYIDKTDGMTRKTQGPEPLRITAETDRVYLGTRATCVVEDPVAGRRLVVEKQGSEATVIWNPWIAKARAMPDFGDDEWPGMLCVESANGADYPVRLPPKQRHLLRAVIWSEPL